jgi:hypothetical protein
MVFKIIMVFSVSITTNVVSSSPNHGGVYSTQYYVIKLVSDLREVGTMTALVNKIEINVKQIFEYQILHFDKLTRSNISLFDVISGTLQ